MQAFPSAGPAGGQRQDFTDNGFVRIDGAFPAALARDGRDLLWAATALSPGRPEGWVQPVVRIPFMTAAPALAAADTPRLHRAYDALVGPGRWIVPEGLGSFPIRFPSASPPDDDGWHIDASFDDTPISWIGGSM